MTTGITATAKVADYGREIARAYWLSTPHVWKTHGYISNGGVTTHTRPDCQLCGGPESAESHKPASPPMAPITIVSVTDTGMGGGHHFEAVASCGHKGGYAVSPARAPKVGDRYSCWTCEGEYNEIDFPPLPADVMEQIAAAAPKCPECGGKIETVYFEAVRKHSFEIEADGYTGELGANSMHVDTIEIYPDLSPEARVECANKHQWREPRLIYCGRRSSHDEERWGVMPPDIYEPASSEHETAS